MLMNEPFSNFNVMILRWVKVAVEYFSGFCLALSFASFVTALCHLSVLALLILYQPVWHIITQWKSIGRQLTVCTDTFHTDWQRVCTRMT